MRSFCALLLERGVADLDDIDAALARQMLHGGDVATNMLQTGSARENALQRLLADYYEMPAGPQGRLDEPGEDVLQLVPKSTMRRYRVFPYRRTPRTLHLAVCAPLDPDVEKELRSAVDLQLRASVVSSVRLAEALWRHCGVTPPEHVRSLIDGLDAQAQRDERAHAGEVDQEAPPSRPYRRMSEHPEGVRVSKQNPDLLRAGRTDPIESEGPAPDAHGSWLDSAVAAQKQAPAASGEPAANTLPRRNRITPTMPSPIPVPSEPVMASHQPAGRDNSTAPPGLSYPPDIDEVVRESVIPGEPPEVPRRPTPPPPSLSRSDPAPAAELERISVVPIEPSIRRRGVSMPPRRSVLRDNGPVPDTGDFDEIPLSIRSEVARSLPPVGRRDGRSFRHHGPLFSEDALAAAAQARDVQFVLDIVVRFARQYFDRLMLMVVHGERAEARVRYGIGADLDSLRVDLSNPSLMRRAYDDGHTVVDSLGYDGVDAVLRTQLGLAGEAAPVAVIPIAIRDRTIALLYGDDAGEPVDPQAVQAVSELAEAIAGEIGRIIVARKRK
jgi:hypothetical protein